MSTSPQAQPPPERTLVVDARGLACPLPVIRLAAAARAATPGTVVTVWWTDPAARHDVPAWARMRSHTLVGTCPLEQPADRTGPSGPQAWATTVVVEGPPAAPPD
ncbi:sulfurtransferase TusA family protein [Actinotalea sp. K2]|uniref:sulfurtransferase TusA family protein n=1 Tax=Actinotalea sp. K2 TaxID=2939438 RepID=UPI0020181DA1|nr:sulfurtransferase TusA family protein [Actinotalea sp. K2]MCL3862155.1 sulfurtransferase TusA family protein [Actinotalea sp. K2]